MRLNYPIAFPAACILAFAQCVRGQTVVTAPADDIIAIAHDLDNHYSLPNGNFPGGEDPTKAIDGNIFSKYLNFAGAGFDDDGNLADYPTGFLVTLKTKGASPINGFRMATGNDAPSRDPALITIEGTNLAGSSTDIANTDADSDWTLIYAGVSGLHVDQARSTWGDTISFTTSDTYKSYRIIITDLIRYAGNPPTNSQFGEMEMTYTPVPEPASAGLLGLGALASLRRRRGR